MIKKIKFKKTKFNIACLMNKFHLKVISQRSWQITLWSEGYLPHVRWFGNLKSNAMFALKGTEIDINCMTPLPYLVIDIICLVLFTMLKWPWHGGCRKTIRIYWQIFQLNFQQLTDNILYIEKPKYNLSWLLEFSWCR